MQSSLGVDDCSGPLCYPTNESPREGGIGTLIEVIQDLTQYHLHSTENWNLTF